MDPIFDFLLELNIIEEADATCFYVDASIETGCYALLVGAVLLNLLSQLVTRAATAAAEDRMMRASGRRAVPHITCFRLLSRACISMATVSLDEVDLESDPQAHSRTCTVAHVHDHKPQPGGVVPDPQIQASNTESSK